jgi:hypothetical protein
MKAELNQTLTGKEINFSWDDKGTIKNVILKFSRLPDDNFGLVISNEALTDIVDLINKEKYEQRTI